MLSALSFILLFFSLTSLSSCLLSYHASTSRPTGFSSKLVNRNSVRSPFYNPNLKRSDRIRESILCSFARQNYLQTVSSNKISPNSLETVPLPADGEYIMEFYTGTPAVKTYAILDTGSSLTWLQCLPCKNSYIQTKVPIFDPAKSSTFKLFPCNFTCQRIAYHQCSSNYCQYHITYADTSFSKGDIAEETLLFRDSNGNNASVQNFVFGCSHDNIISVRGEGIPGVMGLVRNRYDSLIKQLNFDKFAYCFGEYDEPDAHGYAMFGDAASISGYTTPILVSEFFINSFYYINLEGISVDNTTLPIPNETFNITSSGQNGFIIDSGTHFTYLKRTAFTLLCDTLAEKMRNLKRVVIPIQNFFNLCYEYNRMDLKVAPLITLHFTGVDMQLPLWNTWINVEGNIHCLAMFPTDGISILGNFQQQNFHIGYDVLNGVISINSLYCADD